MINNFFINIISMNIYIYIGNEYPDSGVGSEPEGKCDNRNEEGDGDSDAESPSPPQHSSFVVDETKTSDEYNVNIK